MTPLTYTMADMRILFQTVKDESLRKLITHLEAHGFPPRLPHRPGTHALWSKPAVDHWLQNWGTTTPTPLRHPREGGDPASFEHARAEAESRYQ